MTTEAHQEARACREAVLRAWLDTLERVPESDEQNFFEAGGNSILAVQFQRRLAGALGRRISLKEIHENPTVRGLLGLRALRGRQEAARDAGPASVLNLYCLPYAGSSARIYAPWQDELPSRVTLVPLELPGRGTRWSEPAKSDLSELLDDLAGHVQQARQTPYAIFGHSFGGVLAFELARHLRTLGFPAPRRLLVSGCPAPHLAVPDEPSHDLPAEEFVRRLRQLRGTPEELLENDELMELYIPVIRADYIILDHYKAPRAEPLNCAITSFYGRDDEDVDRDAAEAWNSYSDDGFSVEEIAGDHFFLRDSQSELLAGVTRYLTDDADG
ncbi:alpha/beta fold hydrolase [Streptomyces sp. NPDC017936]|uniref:alpha/beta fold hydrolase n=1 Tax=Streptomyces sp. NPDC017936 TaxID=3365016 RepID=UPI0037B3889B